MKTKHTPTPWKVHKGNHCIAVMKNEQQLTLTHVGTSEPSQRVIADSEFIVQCVNCHDELLEACKIAFDMMCDACIQEGTFCWNERCQIDCKEYQHVKQAIEKAESNN